MRYLRTFLFLLVVILASNATTLAAESAKPAKSGKQFPHGCRTVGYEFQHRLLLLKPVSETPKITTLYLIHNRSHYAVSLAVVKLSSQPFSPSYKNTISAGQWGAFALNQSLLQLSCNANGFQVDCQNVLELCQYNRAKFAEHNQGTYWIIRDGSRHKAVRGSINNGILLRW